MSVGLTFAAEAEEVYAGTVWAAGVNQYNGWYDVDKSPTDARDDMMCYAASASNLLAWWLNGDSGRQLTPTSPTKLEDIWAEFLTHCINPASGGDPLAAVNWWISGVYAPTNEAEELRSVFNLLAADSSLITLKVFDGYYFDQYGLNKESLAEFMTFTTDYTASYFGDLLKGGAGVSLLLNSETGALAHAITLWGADYAGDGSLEKLWITDSDDDASALVSIDVRIGSNGKVYFDENGEIGDYEWYQYMGITGIHIYGVSAIHPEASASWRLVPEPATTTLSLLTLAAMTLRRRRR